MMRVFSWPRLSLMRARLLFSMMGLEDLEINNNNNNNRSVLLRGAPPQSRALWSTPGSPHLPGL